MLLAATDEMPRLVLIIGVLSVSAILLKKVCDRFSLPPVVGYLILGISLSELNRISPVFETEGPGETVLRFFAALGVVVLLFRVGIESDLGKLRQQLPKASLILLTNIVLSAVPSYFVTRHLLDYGMIPSLFVAVAMTATSVGVSVAVWEQTGKMKSKQGSLLLDTAELDDIAGVGLMALLLSIFFIRACIYFSLPSFLFISDT